MLPQSVFSVLQQARGTPVLPLICHSVAFGFCQSAGPCVPQHLNWQPREKKHTHTSVNQRLNAQQTPATGETTEALPIAAHFKCDHLSAR